MSDERDTAHIELVEQRRQIVRVGIHVVSNPRLTRAAFRWVFGALAIVGALAAAVARSIPDVDLALASPDASQ
jgi:hypothetical protein